MKSFLDTVDVNNLTSSEQIIYQYFKDHLNNIVYLSLSDICKELYVSNATVIRFSQKLGFKKVIHYLFLIISQNKIPSTLRT